MNSKSSSIETNTSSFTSYTNVSANQLPSHLAQTLENDLVVENIFDKCNIDDKRNGRNISPLKSKIEHKDPSSESNLNNMTNIISASTPNSPTSKNIPTLNGNNGNCKVLNGYKTSGKTSPTHSCDLCNVIVNSAAQLTQVIKL